MPVRLTSAFNIRAFLFGSTAMLTSPCVVLADVEQPAGHSISLQCPPMQYYVDPKFEVSVSNPAASDEPYSYTYTLKYTEGELPFFHFTIYGLSGATIENTAGAIRSCEVLKSDPLADQQALNCWLNLDHPDHDASPKSEYTGTIRLTSPYAPGVGTFIARTASLAMVSKEQREALLPQFNNDNEFLTEALTEAAAAQCSSATAVGKGGRAMSGALMVPFNGSASSGQPAIASVNRDELSDALLRLRDEIQQEASTRFAGKDPQLGIMDSAFRIVQLDEIGPDQVLHGKPYRLNQSVPLKDIATSCNVRAVLVLVMSEGTVLDRRALTIAPEKACEFYTESFSLELPADQGPGD